MYELDLNSPILFLWAGRFLSDEDYPWKHKDKTHSENFEVFLPIKNSLEVNINGIDYFIQENEFFLVPPKAVIKHSSTTNHELDYYWFHFLSAYSSITNNDQHLSKGVQEVASLNENTHLNNSIVLPMRFLLSHPERIIVLINQLLHNDNVYQYTKRGNDFFLILLLIAISDDYLKLLSRKSTKQIKKTALIAEWVRVNISKDLTLATIATQFNLNPNYLSRIFKSEQGIGVKNYILTIKLDHAKRLLSTTMLTINEVAEQSFFYDPKHFMRAFKLKNGVTPSQYREENSHTNLNSSTMNHSDPLPKQLGNKALQQLISEILEKNQN
ncbi:helix-turn-helix domain-containing protein [Vagococcus sp. BWB3-3]|uniref:Helix-turn-helix domain-containing protein n=1 Tax=Vagococcus allomyrinae TaxID=2794353 RepID=A0A940P6E7_9ENTE|nr:AraC family transcriptional regulator [Vagococcus allomyrinae]MBP1042484.1 helix-turn-helix domain-containing protein [Vagococcus allomyrinae]